MWNIFFFKISRFTICFFVFLLFLTFSFQFRLSVLFKNLWKFLCFFILWIRDFMIDFWKIMEHFSKKYRHLKSKILHKFHYLLFFLFIYLEFLTSFFPISPNHTCQRILNIFVVLSCTDYRFYQRILENSWILFKKNKDIVNTQHFQNYYLLFNFVVFLTSFFLVYLSVVFEKFLKFLCCFIVWIRDFTKDLWKIKEHFSKKYRHLKSKIIHKFHYLLFVFFLFYYHFWRLFFLFHRIKLVKKI